jgi:hypothetical protein
MASSGLIGMAGGIGGEMVKQADEERKLIANKDFETWRLGVLNEMKAQDDIRTDARADQRRMDRVARVDSAKQGLVSDAMGAKYAGSDAAVAAADAGQTDAPLSAEQKAVISQAKGTDRTAMMNDPMTSVQASVKTGDLLPHDAAVLALGEKRADREERKIAVTEAANAARERQTDLRDLRKWETELLKLDLQQGNLDAQNRKIDAMIAHWERGDKTKEDAASKGKTPTADRMGAVINAMNATIKNLDENRPKSTASAEEKADWQTQKDNAFKVRARATAQLNERFDDGGTDPAPKPAPTTAPKPAAKPASRPPLSNFLKK